MRCPTCSRETPAGSIVCPFCATSLAEAPTSLPGPDGSDAATSGPGQGLSEAATVMPESDLSEAATSMPTAGAPPAAAVSTPAAPDASQISLSDAGQHGRFLPGTVVAGRYRIAGLLGRGGMGEVYRADDLKLGQQVALKFLPPAASANQEHVDRLVDEVRMARKVSHPNVCRVWDIGEAEGQHYVSMEYVDGEDLASLLRRIGRLPEDKAVEIARQLCAALAAAHDEGVLHRDLKPANVMIDGRGRVKLTDFGLAGVAEVRAGTPIYMAPEQLAGEEVSVLSDVYSLGLVLHELFTGKKVFDAEGFDELSRQHQSLMSTSMTTTAGFDPAVERVIQRCLEKDPAKRPQTALAVAAGLPGADPLAAALAAGETPSPEMVAEAGGEGTLRATIAVPLLLVTFLLALAVGGLQSRWTLIGWAPFEQTPAMLDARAREILADLGYEAEQGDTAADFVFDRSYVNWLADTDAAPERFAAIAEGRPASIAYWWRSSPSTLVPQNRASTAATVTPTSPARTTPGMKYIEIDTTGRLRELDIVPIRLVDDSAVVPQVDWATLFTAAEFDIATFEPVEPRLTPPHFADQRAAWEGVYAEDPEVAVRIEAAAFRGRPIMFRVFTPFDPLERPGAPALSDMGFSFGLVLLFGFLGAALLMALTVIFGGLYVALRNARSGRGDARGARRLALTMGIAVGVSWVLGAHTMSPADVNWFVDSLILACAAGVLAWALYLAVEPFMRRHLPGALIGWTRLMDGRFSDPLVGRDLLLGCAMGALSKALELAPMAIEGHSGQVVDSFQPLPVLSVATLFDNTVGAGITMVISSLALLFLYGLTFVALRRRHWLAAGLWLLILGGMGFVPGVSVNEMQPSETLWTSIGWALGWALALFVLLRLGILVYVVMGVTADLLARTLPTLDFTAWYSPSMTMGLTLFLAIAAYGLFCSVSWHGGIADALVDD